MLEFGVGKDVERTGVSYPISYSTKHNHPKLVDYVVKKIHADGKIECVTECLVNAVCFEKEIMYSGTKKNEPKFKLAHPKVVVKHVVSGYLRRFPPNRWFTWHGPAAVKSQYRHLSALSSDSVSNVHENDSLVVCNPFNKTPSMPDVPFLKLQYSQLGSSDQIIRTRLVGKYKSKTERELRSNWGGYLHLHMEAFLVPAGFPKAAPLIPQAKSAPLSDSEQAVMFGRVRTQHHIHGQNPAPYFADALLIIQPDCSCCFYQLDARGRITGSRMDMLANHAISPLSYLLECPFPCTFLPGELQPNYTPRENWQCLEIIAKSMIENKQKASSAKVRHIFRLHQRCFRHLTRHIRKCMSS